MQAALNTTDLIQSWQNGDQDAFGRLIEHLYDDLKALSRRQLYRENRGSKYQTTELLSELCLLMMNKQEVPIQNRKHFLNTAAQAVYRFLIDEARRRKALKNNGDVTSNSEMVENQGFPMDHEKVILAHQVIEDLSHKDPLTADIVILRYFAGFTIHETANLLEVSTPTVSRKSDFGRALILQHFEAVLAGEAAPELVG